MGIETKGQRYEWAAISMSSDTYEQTNRWTVIQIGSDKYGQQRKLAAKRTSCDTNEQRFE